MKLPHRTRLLLCLWPLTALGQAPDTTQPPFGEPIPVPLTQGDITNATGAVLPEVVIVDSRTAKKGSEVAASTTVLDQDASVFSLATSMRDYQRYEPGVSVPFGFSGGGPSRSGRSGTGSINIRGLDGNRVLMQTDGIRQADQFNFGGTTNIGRDYLDVDALKQVEILKNAASSLYGSDALGGVVSFVTKDPADILNGKNWGIESTTRFDTADDSFSQTLASAMKTGQLEWLVLHTWRQGNETDNRGTIIPDLSDYEVRNWLAKLVWKPDKHHTFKLTGEYLQRESSNDLLNARRQFLSSGFIFRTNSMLLDDEVSRYRLSLGHEYDRGSDTGLVDRFNWQIYFQESRTDEHILEDRDRITPTFRDRFRDRNNVYWQSHVGAQFNLVSNFATGSLQHSLAYGAEFITSFSRRTRDGTEYDFTANTTTKVFTPDTFPLKDMPDSETLRYGAYIQDEISWGPDRRYILTPGLRIEYYQIHVDNDALYLRASGGNPGTDYEKFSIAPKLSFLAKLDEQHSAYFRYAMGFRNPTPEDLNGTVTNIPFNYMTIPNPDLKNETSQSFELGLRGQYDKAAWSLAAYYNHYQNFIQLFANAGGAGTPASPTIFQSQNLSQATIYGVEFKGDTCLDFISPVLRNVTLFGNAAYSQGWDGQNDQPLASIDPFKAVVGLRYAWEDFQLEFMTTYTARQGLTSGVATPNQFVPSAFVMLDLVARWQVTEKITFTAGLYNLTNEKAWRYQDVRGLTTATTDLDRYTLPGINARLALNIRF
jgi:hemoglobin/transferrin/lactoferrin receptor protein